MELPSCCLLFIREPDPWPSRPRDNDDEASEEDDYATDVRALEEERRCRSTPSRIYLELDDIVI
jgi:hypothetical protein